jgi:ribonuclease HI
VKALLEVHSDGSAAERMGRPGGWAFVIVREDELLAVGTGGSARTTCLVMELEAARAGLVEVLTRDWQEEHRVELVSDSSIALEIASGRFTPRPRAYAAQAQALREAALATGATTRWVPAHQGHRWNERVDALAREARTAAEASRRSRPPR